MLKLASALMLGLATTAAADPLHKEYEIAAVMLETEIFRAGGHAAADAANYARWDAQRRADSLCALQELEALRGRPAAERYVREYAKAASDARSAGTSSDIIRLVARAHARAKLDLNTVLLPITRKCGVGL